MKTKLCFLLVCILALVPYVTASSQTKLSAISDGDTVHIMLTDVEDLCGFDLKIEWTSDLILIDYALHSPWTNSFVVIQQVTETSYRIVIVGLKESFTGSIELVTLTFEGKGTVSFSTVKLSNSEFQSIPISTSSGYVSMMAPEMLNAERQRELW